MCVLWQDYLLPPQGGQGLMPLSGVAPGSRDEAHRQSEPRWRFAPLALRLLGPLSFSNLLPYRAI